MRPNLERDVADIHSDLQLRQRARRISKLHPRAHEPDHFPRHAPDDAPDRVGGAAIHDARA
jgi:hypothetical protein